MARYDRIARLDAPPRAGTFPCWLAVRDLEGRERDPELGRRARLRFLALRPARRLLARGVDGVDTRSLTRQVSAVRDEMRRLPAGDPERDWLDEYLGTVEAHDLEPVILGILALGTALMGSSHGYAAEEYLLTGSELAAERGMSAAQASALRVLADLYGGRGRWDRALECLDEAAAVAREADDLAAWADVMEAGVRARLRAGDGPGAGAAAAALAAEAEGTAEPRLAAAAAAARCAVELAAGRPEAALEVGWRAVEILSSGDAGRHRVLLDLGSAFRRLRLRAAAEACYRMITDEAADSNAGAEARLEHALVAAEARDAAEYHARSRTLEALADEADTRRSSAIHIGLGRGDMLIGDIAGARNHLRTAMTTARDAGFGDAAARAEELLSALERQADLALADQARSPSDGARTIAQRIESLEQQLVPSG